MASSRRGFGSAELAGYHKTPIVKQLWEARLKCKEAGESNQASGVSSGPKTVRSSVASVRYHFSQDAVLRDSYLNPWGGIRMGRIFEDLDALAGNIASFHCLSDLASTANPPPADNISIVTASVEEVRVVGQRRPLTADMDLSGRVSWVGRSSMQIDIDLQVADEKEPWLQSAFIFVAQDTTTGKPVSIPPIVAESAAEIAVFEKISKKHEAAKQERAALKEKQKVGGALASLIWPNEQAMAEARASMIKTRLHQDLPYLARTNNEVLMSRTRLTNTMICQPQHRNTRGNIFGGFIIRRAFELAHTTAYLLAGAQPRLTELDNVQFLRPVKVGALLRLEAAVLYTDQEAGSPTIHVEVVARSIKPQEMSSEISTVLNMTFEVAQGTPLPSILPDTIEDARRALIRKYADSAQEQERRQTSP